MTIERLADRLMDGVSAIATRKPRYFIYARYSSEGQHDGSSEERQLDMEWHRHEAERLCAEMVEIAYIDRAKSGFRRHPQGRDRARHRRQSPQMGNGQWGS